MAATGTQQQHLTSTAQQYLDILDITNDLVILKDGSAALVLKVSAINFGLLSEPEQDAIIYAYAALINSLSFPIEILIKSKPKDVTNYLNYIDEQLQHAVSDQRRAQIQSYRQFVANLITEQNVLDKTFFVVLPLSGLELGLASSANPFNGMVPNQKAPVIDRNYVVEKANNILLPRRDHMINQFGRLGLRSEHLDTKALIQLFYTTYNSQSSDGTRIVETKDYTSAVIQAQGQLPNLPSAAPQPIEAPASGPVPTPVLTQPQMAPAPQPIAPAPAPVITPAPTVAPIAPPPAPVAPVSTSPLASVANLQATVAAIPQESPNAMRAPQGQPR